MKKKMKAALFYGHGIPLVVEEVEKPVPGVNEVLVDIKACGICGSDIHIVFEGITPTGFLPIILGHEPSGVIAEVGDNVSNLKPGDRVVISSCVICGQCDNCLDGRESICMKRKLLGIHLNGGLAEYMVAPANNVIKLPETITFEEGAIITDAVATPFHAITKRGKLQPGETVAIFGCGGLGIHAVQIAKICGASRIVAVDINEAVLERALKAGATDLVLSSKEDPVAKIKKITGNRGVDIVLECVGLQKTITQGIESLKTGGRLIVVGLSSENISLLPPIIFVRSEFSIIGSYAWERADIVKIIKLVENGCLDLSSSITGKFTLDEVNTALEQLYNKVDNPIRIVIIQD